MALKRKRVAPPLFYDIDSNKLYPKELVGPKRCRFDDVCRVCATPAGANNDLIDIYGQHGKTLKLSTKINKFLPIMIHQADSLPHMICVNCRTILFKIDSLYFICQKADVFFHGQTAAGDEPTMDEPNTELLEVFDGEYANIPTYNPDVSSSPTFEPDISDSIGFTETVVEPTAETSSWCLADNEEADNSELPIFEPDECEIKEECLSEFSDTEYLPAITEVKSIEPAKKTTNKSKSVLKSNVEKKSVKVSTKNTKPKSVKASKKVEPTKIVTTTKSGRQVKEVKRFEDESEEHSATESEGNQDSDDPDFDPQVENNSSHYSGSFIPKEKQKSTYDPITALTPKELPLECEYCGIIFKIGPSAECHYEIQHDKHLCTLCFVHYQTQEELVEHYQDEHPSNAESMKPEKLRQKSPVKRKPKKSPNPGSSICKPKKSSRGTFVCTQCDDSFFMKKSLKRHLKNKHETFMCYQCSNTFVDQSQLEEHIEQENHGKICRTCKIDFWCMKSWIQHSRKHYNFDKVKVIMPTKQSDLETPHTIENASGVPVEFNVVTIENQTDSEAPSKEKLSVVTPSSSSSSTTSKVFTQQKFPFQCDLCEEQLISSTVAQDHYKQHDKHMCTYCFKHFTSTDELGEHTEKVHTFSCALCPFKITDINVNSLKKHFVLSHKDECSKRSRLYECGICDKHFYRKRKLMDHMHEIHNKRICYVCLKCFNDENSYRAHLELENHDFECKVCGLNFENKQGLSRHLAFHHPDHLAEHKEKEKSENSTYTCVICEVVHHKLYTIKRHYLLFHKKFFCFLCNLVFESHSDIDNHCLEIHGCNTSWSYKCNQCDKYFEAEEALTLHIKSMHERSTKYNLCEQCGKSYSSVFKLQEHVKKVHENVVTKSSEKIECEICNKLICTDSMKRHLQRHTGVREILCVECGKRFFDTAGLKIHISYAHSTENPFIRECPHCNKKMTKRKLKDHINEEHTADWSYICNQCNVYYTTETDIWKHCFTAHGIIQGSTMTSNPFLRTSPHQCETCLEYLPNAAKLKRHRYLTHGAVVIDTEKHKYANQQICCELCGEMVTRKSKPTHMFRKHKVQRKYPCDLCDASFTKEDLKTKHMEKFHSEDRTFRCDICNRAFITRKRMTTHKRMVHFREPEIPCSYCDKKFKSRNSMVKHTKMHSAFMPFKCAICDMAFHRKQYCENHMKKHEKQEPIEQSYRRRVEILIPENEPIQVVGKTTVMDESETE